MATVILHPHAEASMLPMVLLPPFPCDSRLWEDVATSLAGDVITVDPPGFGGEVDDDPSLEGYARALLAALDERGVGRFVVAGNSMGGMVALAVAELAPERLAGIGMIGSKSVADSPEAAEKRLEMAAKAEAGTPPAECLKDMLPNLLGDTTKAERPGLVSQLGALTDAATPEGIAWAQRAMAARPERTDVLRELTVPGCVVYGAEDASTPPDTQPRMGEALGVDVATVAAVGHLLPIEAPDIVAEALRRLWGEARQTPPSSPRG